MGWGMLFTMCSHSRGFWVLKDQKLSSVGYTRTQPYPTSDRFTGARNTLFIYLLQPQTQIIRESKNILKWGRV